MSDKRAMDSPAPVPIRPTISSSGPPPDLIVRQTLASLRAADVYIRLLIDRIELARSSDLVQLDGVPVATLVRLTAASEALQDGADRTLADIAPDLAARTEVVADLARQSVRS
jgi:hypothetical protein